MTRPPDVAEVLAERARALARPESSEAAGLLDVLVLTTDRGRYAVPLHAVREVVPLAGRARLPRSAQPMQSLVAVRGGIVGLVDVSVLLAEEGADGASAVWGVLIEATDGRVCLAARRVEHAGLRSDVDRGDVEPGGAIEGFTEDGLALLDPAAVIAAVDKRG